MKQPGLDARLGNLIKVFKPKPSSIVLGYFLSGVLVVAGAAIVGLTVNAVFLAAPPPALGQNVWTAGRVVSCLLGVVLISCGAALAIHCWSLAFFRVEVYENGFTYASSRRTATGLWGDVVVIREVHMGNAMRISDDPSDLGYEASRYTIVVAGGEKYEVSSRDLEDIMLFREDLRSVATRLSLPWETTHVPWTWGKYLTSG